MNDVCVRIFRAVRGGRRGGMIVLWWWVPYKFSDTQTPQLLTPIPILSRKVAVQITLYMFSQGTQRRRGYTMGVWYIHSQMPMLWLSLFLFSCYSNFPPGSVLTCLFCNHHYFPLQIQHPGLHILTCLHVL